MKILKIALIINLLCLSTIAYSTEPYAHGFETSGPEKLYTVNGPTLDDQLNFIQNTKCKFDEKKTVLWMETTNWPIPLLVLCSKVVS